VGLSFCGALSDLCPIQALLDGVELTSEVFAP